MKLYVEEHVTGNLKNNYILQPVFISLLNTFSKT